MSRRFGQHAANALTGLRLVLAPAFVATAVRGDANRVAGAVAAAIFAAAATSDVFDGRVARHYGSDSDGGRTFDHLADIGFILSALAMYAGCGIAPWWIPASIGGSFAFYVLDSWARTSGGRRNLIGSRIGHAAGVLNYALIGILVFNNSAGIHLLSPAALARLFWLVPLYSAAAVVARLATPWLGPGGLQREATVARPTVS